MGVAAAMRAVATIAVATFSNPSRLTFVEANA